MSLAILSVVDGQRCWNGMRTFRGFMSFFGSSRRRASTGIGKQKGRDGLSSQAKAPALRHVQNWFQSGVLAPYAKDRARISTFQASRYILPSKSLRAHQRIELYSRMYLTRLEEALEGDYPVVRAVLGEKQFHQLAHAYIRSFPSKHYSLNPFGQQLPKLIQRRVVRPANPSLVYDLARLEAAIQEVFDAPESAALDIREWAQLSATAWQSKKLRFVPAFRLLEFDCEANAIFIAIKHGKKCPRLRKKKTWLAVYRKDDVVWRMDLSKPQYDFLRAIAKTGRFPSSTRASETEIVQWLQRWIGEGFFQP